MPRVTASSSQMLDTSFLDFYLSKPLEHVVSAPGHDSMRTGVCAGRLDAFNMQTECATVNA